MLKICAERISETAILMWQEEIKVPMVLLLGILLVQLDVLIVTLMKSAHFVSMNPPRVFAEAVIEVFLHICAIVFVPGLWLIGFVEIVIVDLRHLLPLLIKILLASARNRLLVDIVLPLISVH